MNVFKNIKWTIQERLSKGGGVEAEASWDSSEWHVDDLLPWGRLMCPNTMQHAAFNHKGTNAAQTNPQADGQTHDHMHNRAEISHAQTKHTASPKCRLSLFISCGMKAVSSGWCTRLNNNHCGVTKLDVCTIWDHLLFLPLSCVYGK